LADVAPLLDRLPILADRLDSVPQAKLRSLFDTMQLDVVYQPTDSTVDVSLTLYHCGDGWRIDTAGAASEDGIGDKECANAARCTMHRECRYFEHSA
jgi:hypothetical protein